MNTVERVRTLAYEMKTRTDRSFWEVTSAMQNAIRKGDYEVAAYAMWELLPGYTPYLRKRLLVISAEDCYGILTKDVMSLCEVGDEESLTKALALLCAAKKNRDADYFVCNLMIPTDPRGQSSRGEMAQALHQSIRKMDVVVAGWQSLALFKKNRKELWKALLETTKVYHSELEDEAIALKEANDRVSKPSEETIFAAKAIILMWTAMKRKDKKELLAHPSLSFYGVIDPKNIIAPKALGECERITGLFPDWAYNWHTYHGKYDLRRDAVHAITNDQQLLTPLEVNLFDDCSWNRDINACLEKWNPHRRPIPYDDGKRNPGEKFGSHGAGRTL